MSFPKAANDAHNDGIIVEENDFEVDLDSHYPTGLIPRIHCLALSKVTPSAYAQKLVIGEADIEFNKQYENILHLLSEITLGDGLVSKYILFTMMARTRMEESAQLVGKMITNVFRTQNIQFYSKDEGSELISFSELLSKLVSILLPKTQYLELNLKNLQEN